MPDGTHVPVSVSDVEANHPLEPDLTLPHVASTLREISRVASVIPLLAGVLVLMGWAMEADALERTVPGLTAMNPTTAVGFMGLGWSLAVLSHISPRPTRRVALAIACVVVILGFCRLVALLGLGDLRLDQLLFRDKLALGAIGRPNRMAPNTALNFVLLGAALIMIDRAVGRFRWPSQLLALVAAMTSLLALIGYAYGQEAFGAGSHVPMSLPTAATFLVVAIGVLCARPTQGIMAVISSDSSGGTMIRRLLPAVLIVPAVFGGLRLAGQRAMPFDSAFGVWLLIVVIMTVLAVLVGWNAQLLFRSDIAHANAEKRLAHQATHDALTELPNRRLFIDRLAAELERAREQRDLDGGPFHRSRPVQDRQRQPWARRRRRAADRCGKTDRACLAARPSWLV